MIDRTTPAGLAAAIALAAAPAAAQDAGWSYQDAYAGWRGTAIVGADVHGAFGEEVGDVEDLILGADGAIDQVVIEAGGVLEVGDTEFGVPWSQVRVAPEVERVMIPLSEEQVEDATGWRAPERLETAAPGDDQWSMRALLDQPVDLEGDADFGEVEDLIFRRDGALLAIVIEAGGDRFALPWERFAVQQGDAGLAVAMTPDEVQALGRFNYRALDDEVFGDD